MSSVMLLGVLIGASVAAPIGPINLLCIRRTLMHGPALGCVSGLGSATGHVLYASLPMLGLNAVSGVLVDYRVWFQLVGGALLAYLGLRALASSGAIHERLTHERGWLDAFGSSFALTLSNPMTIVSFAAAFTGLNLSATQLDPAWFALGVFVGSVAWRSGLCLVASLFRSRLNPHGLKWVNRGAALALTGFGVLGLMNALMARAA